MKKQLGIATLLSNISNSMSHSFAVTIYGISLKVPMARSTSFTTNCVFTPSPTNVNLSINSLSHKHQPTPLVSRVALFISRAVPVAPFLPFFKKLWKSRYLIKLPSIFLFFTILLFLIQLCTPGFVGVDAYYHVKISELMIKHGVFNEFPWAQTSIWKDHFADKEFLFHVYLIPFIHILPNLMIAGKIAISILGGVFFLLFYRLLNQFQIRHSLIWTLITFSVNFVFLQRMCMVRPHVLSLVLTLLFIESLWRQKLWQVLIISFIYPLAYTAAHFLTSIAIIYLAILWLHQQKLRINFLLLTLGGTILGLVVHPNFPSNIRVWYIQNAFLPIFNWGKSNEFWFVSEHTSLPLGTFIGAYSPTILLFSVSMAVVFFNRRNLSSNVLFIFFLACSFLGMTVLSTRFVEYWVPLTVLSCALSLNTLRPIKSTVLKIVIRTGQIGLLSFSIVIYILAILLIPIHEKPELKEAAHWLRTNTPQRAIIFTANWSDFPQLLYFNIQNYYLFGLDPIYCYAYNTDLWDLWVAIVSGERKNPGFEIQNIFHADYILGTSNPAETEYALTEQLLQNSQYRVGYEDENYLIFVLK